MSFISLESTGVQTAHIMADTVDAKQILLSLSGKPNGRMALCSPVFSLNASEYPTLERLHKPY